jgi:hypothetical protein
MWRWSYLVALSMGCTGNETDLCRANGEPSLSLGRLEEGFVPFSEGETVELEYGLQGGQHIPVTVWAAHLKHPRTVRVSVDGSADAAPVLRFSTLMSFQCEDPSVGLIAPYQTFFVDDPSLVHDKDVLVRVEVVDPDQSASVEQLLHVVDPGNGG